MENDKEVKEELAHAFGLFICYSCHNFYAIDERAEEEIEWRQMVLPFKEFCLCPVCEEREWKQHIN